MYPAATVTVSSLADLQKAISKAESGDNLLFSNGIYKTTTDINIDRRGLQNNL
jgi:poly(beta-D-mannuronate) lyase